MKMREDLPYSSGWLLRDCQPSHIVRTQVVAPDCSILLLYFCLVQPLLPKHTCYLLLQ